MVVFNYAGSEINAKIVYYGPALGGKTTNLEYIYERMPSDAKGKMVSMKTRTDRTLFFDFLPIELGAISGFKTRMLLYTVPGQVYYNATRKLVLKGADAVVFVADSDPSKLKENIASLRNLEENLNEHDLTLDTIPWLIQYNKRDLAEALPIRKLEAELNLLDVPTFEAIATQGIGVYETFQSVAVMLYKRLSARLEQSADGVRTGGEGNPSNRPGLSPGDELRIPIAGLSGPDPAPAVTRGDGGRVAREAPRSSGTPELTGGPGRTGIPVGSVPGDSRTGPAGPKTSAASTEKTPQTASAASTEKPPQTPSAMSTEKPSQTPSAASGVDPSLTAAVDTVLREVGDTAATATAAPPAPKPTARADAPTQGRQAAENRRQTGSETADSGTRHARDAGGGETATARPAPAQTTGSDGVKNGAERNGDKLEMIQERGRDGEDESFRFESLEEGQMDQQIGRVVNLDAETAARPDSPPAPENGVEFLTNPCTAPPDAGTTGDEASVGSIAKAKDVELNQRPSRPPRQPEEECVITVPVLLTRSQIRKTIPIKLTLEIQIVDDDS